VYQEAEGNIHPLAGQASIGKSEGNPLRILGLWIARCLLGLKPPKFFEIRHFVDYLVPGYVLAKFPATLHPAV